MFSKWEKLAAGGLGMINPILHIRVSQIVNFISNTWQRTQWGILLEIVLDDFALEIGMVTPWTQHKVEKCL